VEIVNESGVPLSGGKEGIVRIKSRYGATEYMDDPEETARVFHDGWFHPGDLGYLTPDNMLVISGRARSVLNVGGEKLSPERVEEILSAHPSVMQAAAVALPDELGVEQVCALIVPRSYLDAAALRAHCTGKIPGRLVPVRFIAVNEIPRNETGKIERDKLPALVKSKLN
jgi:acyl-CoA synthetase (AMP-forming)/AMP-acid ligase II